ncbi:unnamed protein product [Caenorhabditis angaria]|uniref:Peptidase M13 C-terminal domain-containing protein n=1 Tax=Caenorhabditis angaria TaxID=860376 RepID=A0A9P1NAX8_9PELO|nr:unnamed protein product [Caenorhabditis angaria]
MNMLQCYFFIILIILIHKSKSNLNPCDDFHDYVCSSDDRIIRNFTVERENIVRIPKGFIDDNKTLAIENVMNFTYFGKWYIEMLVLYNRGNTIKDCADIPDDKKPMCLIGLLDNINTTEIDVFYNALLSNINILETIKPPNGKRNRFLHWMFQTLKNETLKEIQRNGFAKDVFGVKNVHSFYALYDFNNVTVYKKARHAYETKFHQVSNNLSKKDKSMRNIDKFIRFAAIDAAMQVIQEYLDKYDARFMFQAIIANPTNDAFQYLGNIHIAIITRNDLQQPNKAIADTVFVTLHEILHKVYPYGEAEFENDQYSKTYNCSAESIKYLGKTDKVTPVENWFTLSNSHEDIVNIMALRVVMRLIAQKSINEEQMKKSLENLMGGLCVNRKMKNSAIPQHHPLELSLNNAVRQYPLFNNLYNCKKGDRMFVDLKDQCKPIEKNISIDDFVLGDVTNRTDVGGFFEDLLRTAKNMGFYFGEL